MDAAEDAVMELNTSAAFADLLGRVSASNSPNEKSHGRLMMNEKLVLSPSNRKRKSPLPLEDSFSESPKRRVSLHERMIQQFQKNRSLLCSPGTNIGFVSATDVLNASLMATRHRLESQEGESEIVDGSTFYGLPSEVEQMLRETRGITQLYAWQDACLRHEAILRHRNLIISMPTSGGKTLVAEVLILRQIFQRRRDAILILPFVSIVEEKVRALAPFALKFGFLVEEYAGTKGRIPPVKHRRKNVVYIATIERAATLLNALFEAQCVDRLGLAVVDELHMLGEQGDRGSLLEQTLTRLRCFAPSCQLVGMSATLSNLNELERFLDASSFVDDFRPVQLTEHIKLGATIFRIKSSGQEDSKTENAEVASGPNGGLLQFCRTVMSSSGAAGSDRSKKDPDQLVQLVLETIPESSLLIFCSSKKNTENVALLLAKMLPDDMRQHKKAEKRALYDTLKRDCGGRVCSILKVTLAFGIAYHHSGLTLDERALIEDAFRDGTLSVITCTSTLAAGVNLPAKRVIIRSPTVGIDFIDYQKYKQMVGRAGRAGLDSTGESITILQAAQRKRFLDLLKGQFQPCRSSLGLNGYSGLKTLVLGLFGQGMVLNRQDVQRVLEKTLFAVQLGSPQAESIEREALSLSQILDKVLQDLLKLGFIKRSEENGADEPCATKLLISRLGSAVCKGNICPEHAGVLYADLARCLDTLVLSTHLHLLYCVIPYDMMDSFTPDYREFYAEYCSLGKSERQVFDVVGIHEQHLFKLSSGIKASSAAPPEAVFRRMYLALVCHAMWTEQPIWAVASKFCLTRGYLQSLLKSTAASAGSILRFCEPLEEFWALKELLPNFVKRLSYCVHVELVPLMELQCVKQGRARQLFNAGFKTIGSVAQASTRDLARAIENLPLKQARQIIESAKILVQERMEALLEEADELLQ